MTIIRLYADDQKLAITGSPKVACGDVNSVQILVSFSGNWIDYEKSAVFFSSCDPTVYEVMMADNRCIVPHEVLRKSGCFHIGLRGVNPATQAVKTSTLVKYKIEKGAPVGDATGVEPTPDVYQQILTKLAELKGPENIEDVVMRAIEDYMRKNKPSVATIGVVELRADRWESNGNLHSQVVSIDGVTEHSQVDLTPSVEQLKIFYEKDLTFVTENDGGIVTVYAIGQRPEHDYTIQVTITEVIV